MTHIRPFHTENLKYMGRWTYHDDNECPEGRKISPFDRLDGDGGKAKCPICRDLGLRFNQ